MSSSPSQACSAGGITAREIQAAAVCSVRKMSYSVVPTVSLLYIYLSSVSGIEETIYIYGRSDSYRRYFQPPSYTGEQWILEVEITRFGRDFIAFFATDKDRPLDYPCTMSTAICDFSIIKSATEGSIHLNAHIRKLYLPTPTMAGPLMICIGFRHMFWLRPLMKQNRDFLCKAAYPSRGLRDVMILDYNSRDDRCERKYSCRGVFFIDPQLKVIDGVDLNIHTWYMTKDNYADMHSGKLTEVFVPLFHSYNFALSIVGSLTSSSKFDCTIQTPSDRRTLELVFFNGNVTRMKHDVPAIIHNSGVYNITCMVSYHDFTKDDISRVSLWKSLKITFFKGILIKLSEDIVYLAPNITATSIMVFSYTTSPVYEFQLKKLPDEKLPDTTFVEFVSSSVYDVETKHRIVLTWVDNNTTGQYEINLKNEQFNEERKTFHIIRIEALRIVVGPYSLTLEEGSSAMFYCVAFGNVIKSVRWERELRGNRRIVSIKLMAQEKDCEARSLTLLNITLEDSGLYVCMASNKLQTVSATTKLIVWPRGMIVGSPPRVDIVRLPLGPSVLNISDEEIELEYKSKYEDNMTSGSKVEILVGVLLLVVLTSVLTTLVYYQYRRAKKKDQNTTNKMPENENMQKKSILKEEEHRGTKYHFPGKRAINKIKRKVKRLPLKKKVRHNKTMKEEEMRSLVGYDEDDEDDLSRTIEELDAERSTEVTPKEDYKRKENLDEIINIADKHGNKKKIVQEQKRKKIETVQKRKKVGQEQTEQKRTSGKERKKSLKTETMEISEGIEKITDRRRSSATSGRVHRRERNMQKTREESIED